MVNAISELEEISETVDLMTQDFGQKIFRYGDSSCHISSSEHGYLSGWCLKIMKKRFDRFLVLGDGEKQIAYSEILVNPANEENCYGLTLQKIRISLSAACCQNFRNKQLFDTLDIENCPVTYGAGPIAVASYKDLLLSPNT